MLDTTNIISDIRDNKFSKEHLLFFLNTDNKKIISSLFNFAYNIKKEHVGINIYLRALIEISNICDKNCLYCGIRHDNNIKRYIINDDDVLNAVKFAHDEDIGSIVLQSGEIANDSYTNRIVRLLDKIKSKYPNLGITLSLGEQSFSTYKKFFDAGAKRYLLRIETSNRDLFKYIHTKSCDDYEKRLECLYMLKEIGYHTGSGFMVGLPNQSMENIADDIIFMFNFNIDMLGFGPFIPHKDTPLYKFKGSIIDIDRRVELTLIVTSLMRIIMKDINIAASTALETLDEDGKKHALLSGANIIMPNVTDDSYRYGYNLYEGKTKHVTYKKALQSIDKIALSIGESVGYGLQGDSKHYVKRGGKKHWQ